MKKQFFFVVKASDKIELPLNLPSPTYVNYSSAQIGHIQDQLKPHERVENVNYFNPNSLYWGKDEGASIYMSYLPFFSNCQVNNKKNSKRNR